MAENRLRANANGPPLEAAMRPDPTVVLFVIAVTALALAGVACADEWPVTSPDGRIVITARQAGGPQARLEYSVSCAGAPLLEPSPLGIVRADTGFVERLTLEAA